MIEITQHEQDLQRIKNFRLMDDDFMSKCFEDLGCTELVLRVIIGRDDLIVKQVVTQYDIKNLQGRSVRLDIFATDRDGRKYDIEIQRSDKGGVVKRARYNSSMLDANITNPGDDYEDLLETYVIFIMEKDRFDKNLPIYHVERMIQETGESFGDEAHIVYVNGAYQDDTALGKLMHDFSCKDPDEMQYKELAERVRYFKENPKGVERMCRMMEEMRAEAAEKAAREAAIATARKVSEDIAKKLLLAGKMTVEEIAETTKLSLEDVMALAGQ